MQFLKIEFLRKYFFEFNEIMGQKSAKLGVLSDRKVYSSCSIFFIERNKEVCFKINNLWSL